MKKLIACLILVIMLAVPLTSYADEAVTEAEKWDMSVPAELTEDIQTLFDKAMENLVGVHYTPVAVLGARGNTYCILCKARVVYPGAEPYNVLVYINENGIQNIYELWIEKHAEKETPDAVSLLREAAEQGDADAQNELGKCYASGSGVEQSYEEAARYYRMAADQGFAKSQFNLANLYLYGLGVEQDYDKANALLQLAADQGLAHAQYYLGCNFENGIGFVQDVEKAVEYYKLAAKQGLAEAQNDLGNCYMYGKGVARDEARAVKYYQLAADQGEPYAQNNLGCCFFDGTGVERNYEEGMKYFLLAAEQGNPDAIYNLGYNYYHGEGVEQDYQKALEYFNAAADMDFPPAFFLLGKCYYEGNGVEKDVETAKEWFRRALAAGYDPDEEDQVLLQVVLGEGWRSQKIIVENPPVIESKVAVENPYMQAAIEGAYTGITQGHGGPFGSVIVKNGEIIGSGHNRVLINNDPTSHGEITAIRNACSNLGSYDLSGCELYTTGEPCPMCLFACLWANIDKVYYGCTIEDNSLIGFRDEAFDSLAGGRDQLGDYLVCLDRDACLQLFDDYLAMMHEIY